MTEKSKKPSTILLGSYGRGNLGDDVFLVAASELFANHKLYINSADDSLLPESAKGLVETISTTSGSDAISAPNAGLRLAASETMTTRTPEIAALTAR